MNDGMGMGGGMGLFPWRGQAQEMVRNRRQAPGKLDLIDYLISLLNQLFNSLISGGE